MVAFLVSVVILLPAHGLEISRRIWPSLRTPTGLGSLGRRRFLERTVNLVGTVPFVAGAYGLLVERLDLQVTHQTIRLGRLPRAFNGFRLVQLSDIHIGPFMSGAQIRKWVEVANQLRPDLVVLTGDYVTWDPSTQGAAVESLSNLKAPYGVLGSLGNHEIWTHVEDSITRLFGGIGFDILRHRNRVLEAGGETLNFIGVDYERDRHFRNGQQEPARPYLDGVDRLMRPDTANILLSHNPNTFDSAAKLGIDLSLAGHTHGGQITLEFISPDLSPSRLMTKYLRGHYRIGNSQLYVNRGLGTIAIPIRIDAPPEITVFELRREA